MRPPTRRITLALPEDALAEAQRVARSRHCSFSTVIGDALSQWLEANRAPERSTQVLSDYQQAFHGFSVGELMILDGVLPKRSCKR